MVSVARFTPYIVYGNFSFILDTIIRARFKFLGRIKRRLSERIERQIRFDKRFFRIIGLREPKLQICHKTTGNKTVSMARYLFARKKARNMAKY